MRKTKIHLSASLGGQWYACLMDSDFLPIVVSNNTCTWWSVKKNTRNGRIQRFLILLRKGPLSYIANRNNKNKALLTFCGQKKCQILLLVKGCNRIRFYGSGQVQVNFFLSIIFPSLMLQPPVTIVGHPYF